MLQQERNIVYEAVPPAQETQPAPDTRDYSSTYTVISKVAYLIGVPKKFFEAEYAPPQLQTFDQMEREKNARIIRDLCRLRTAIEQNYGRINKAFLYDLKNLHTLPEYIPQECLRRLSEDGIELLRANYKLTQYIIDINLHIANRINNCRDLLPLWLKWEYVRELFLMPNGTKEAGLKRAAEEYCANRTHYPYQVYINWPAQEEQGNILHNDKKFITLLYEMHEDYFADLSKVSDAGNAAKAGIYQFLEGSRRTAIVVDCENSDPYKLYAMLNNLDQNALLGKIAKIILYDDVHTTTAWQILEKFTQIPVEHVLIERVKENKSLVDIRLTTGTCCEFFQNNIETVCLLSKLNAKQHIEVEVKMDELDLTVAESKATYDEIKTYVLENHGLKVSSLYISQIKRKCGLDVGQHYNLSKKEDAKAPQCPPEKEKAIMNALKHFQML